MELSTATEQKIIASAEKLFYRKGKSGASMQEIADDAGINRTLLNYYFRSKDQLFEAVFRNAMMRFVPNISELLRSDISFRDYVPRLIEMVIDTMLEHPQIPIFVLQELTSNPDRMPQIMREMGIDPDLAVQKMKREGWMGADRTMDPRQAILNLLSLCIFPFAARPVVTEILYHGNQDDFRAAMLQRKEILSGLMDKILY